MAGNADRHDGIFPTTRWTLVALAGIEGPRQREALAELLRKYLPALTRYLVSLKRVAPDRADDLVQAFICDKIVQDQLLAKAVRGKGRLRKFLSRSLDRFAIGTYRHDTAQKRSPDRMESLDQLEDVDVSDGQRASTAFDVEWARGIIYEAQRRMQAECEASGRLDVWGLFDSQVLATMEGGEPLPYEQLVERFNLESPTKAYNLLTTAKRMYERNLRAVVGEYVEDEAAIDAELQDLRQILSDRCAES